MKILVAGAGKGIGQAAADLCHERGYEVIAVSRNPQDLEHRPYQTVVLDLENLSSCSQLAALETIDGVINCTGTHPGKKVFSADFQEEINDLYLKNVSPAINLYTVLLPKLRSQCRGHFIHASSIALESFSPREISYCTSKAALEAIVCCLDHEDKERGLRHQAVRVAFTATPLARRVAPSFQNWDAIYQPRETAALLLDLLERPGQYPQTIVSMPAAPRREQEKCAHSD